jgi:hypothetical protein
LGSVFARNFGKRVEFSGKRREVWANYFMNLDDSQRKKVTEWIAQGLQLSEIQNRLNSELGLRMTYMEVRLLVDDLKLTPKDVERVKPSQSPLTAPAAAPTSKQPATAKSVAGAPQSPEPAAGPGGVSVSVDTLARPGAVVSGKVTFSDGNKAEWYLDQAGRLGLVAEKPGYRPPAADVQQFQAALESELSKMGL